MFVDSGNGCSVLSTFVAALYPLYRSPPLFQDGDSLLQDGDLMTLRFALMDHLYGSQNQKVSIKIDLKMKNYENNIGPPSQDQMCTSRLQNCLLIGGKCIDGGCLIQRALHFEFYPR